MTAAPSCSGLSATPESYRILRAMAGQQWSDTELDALRQVGDPLADDTITAIFEAHEIDAVRKVLRHLVDNDHPLFVPADAALDPAVRRHIDDYFEKSDAALPSLDPKRILAGERMFELHGPEILMTLCCYSLPASYTAKKGVQVLAQTGRLESHPKRRLFETTQMVIDVMRPGGLAIGGNAREHGKGIRTAQKVRLMHAAVRHMILHHHGDAWLEKYDVPINQEDMAGTLMTFSWIVLVGLDRLGATVEEEAREAYLYAWTAIGHVMGLREELIPKTLEDAHTLTETIKRRQTEKSEAGNMMAAALVEMMRESIPGGVLSGLPPSMLRFFLQDDARYLDLPPADWTVTIVDAIHGMTRAFDKIAGSSRLSRALYRAFNERLIGAMLRVERGPNRPDFDIPDHLADRWQVQRM